MTKTKKIVTILTAFLISSSLKGQVNSPMKGTRKGSEDILGSIMFSNITF